MPTAGHPSIQLLGDAREIETAYENLLSSARTEVLVFNRPPYGIDYDRPSNVVLDLLGRGVNTRVVYLASLLEHEGFRIEAEAFARAGLRARMADDVPMKLAIIDRRAVLLGTGEAVIHAEPFPPNVVVEEPAFAAAMVPTFEHYWAAARPLPLPQAAARAVVAAAPRSVTEAF